jgi:hypothetical protein
LLRRWGVTIAAVSLVALSQIGYESLTLVPMIGLGIAWASMIGLPSMMVSTTLPKKQTGVYLGVLNMMIVIPISRTCWEAAAAPRSCCQASCSAVPASPSPRVRRR